MKLFNIFKKRAYEGASKKKRLSGWNTPTNRSINAELEGALSTLRARARDLTVNNPYGHRALSVWVSNVIGSGIKPFLNKDNEFERKLKTWMEDPKLCDVAGELNYFQMQELVFKSIVRDGEVIIRKRFSRSNALSGNIPTQLQILEADHLDGTTLVTGPDIVQGVELDDNGKKIFYHISKNHPGANRYNLKSDTLKIKASDVLAPKRYDRAGQVRGVTWFAPIIVRLRNIDEYEDAEIVRQKIAACFTAFITKDESASQGILGSTEQELSELPEKISPANIEILNPGEKVTFSDPPSKEGYDTFMKQNLKAVAVGIDVPYVILADDLSDVNYSSYRGGLLQFFRKVKSYQENIVIAQFCKPVIDWITEDCKLIGIDAGTEKIKHIPPKKDIIDPGKEIPATIEGIRAGLYTLSESILEQGKEPEDHFKQLALDKQKIDGLGLVLDSDAAKSQKNGAVRSEKTTTTNNS